MSVNWDPVLVIGRSWIDRESAAIVSVKNLLRDPAVHGNDVEIQYKVIITGYFLL